MRGASISGLLVLITSPGPLFDDTSYSQPPGIKPMSILQEMVVEVMTELEAEANDEEEDISGGSSEDDTMQFVTAHTNLAALSPNIASSESDTGTMVEHGDNTMVDDMGMGMGTLVITEDGEDDGTMKREKGRG